MKLSKPQLDVLTAAAAGKLEWARPVMSGGGYFVRDDRAPSRSVRVDTAEALIKRDLLIRPRADIGPWSSKKVEITDVGREVLAAALDPSQNRQDGENA